MITLPVFLLDILVSNDEFFSNEDNSEDFLQRPFA